MKEHPLSKIPDLLVLVNQLLVVFPLMIVPRQIMLRLPDATVIPPVSVYVHEQRVVSPVICILFVGVVHATSWHAYPPVVMVVVTSVGAVGAL